MVHRQYDDADRFGGEVTAADWQNGHCVGMATARGSTARDIELVLPTI